MSKRWEELGDWRDPDYTLIGDPDSFRAAVCVQLAGPWNRKTKWLVERRYDGFSGESGQYNTPGLNGETECKDKKVWRPILHGRNIARYVLEIEGSDLLIGRAPEKLEKYLTEMAQFETAAAVEENGFAPIATELLKEAKAKAAGTRHNADRYAQLKRDLETVFRTYNSWIGVRGGYLVCDRKTMPDVLHVPLIRALNECPDAVSMLQEESFDEVAKWWKEMAELDVKTKDLAFN